MEIFKAKRVFALALTILIFFVVKAQSDYRPGYIITLQGDTINGLIEFRGDKENAKDCVFKKSANLGKVTYKPNQIKFYRFVDGKYYLSSVSLNYKFNNPVFLEYIFKGPISIFYYPDDIKDHYFTTKDTSIIELDHHNRLTGNAEEDNLILSKHEKFKAQLKFLFQNQPILFGNIDRIDCNSKDLITITKQYQKLSYPSEELVHYEKKTGGKIKFKFGVLSSVGLSNLSSPPYDMYISDYLETKYLNFKPSFTYEIGAMVNMYLDYTARNKFCFQLSPTLNLVNYSSYEESSLYPLLYVYKLDIRYTTLKIPLLLKYSFYSSNRSILPFIKLGPGVAIYLSQKGNYEYYSVPLSGYTGQPSVFNKPLNQVTNPICKYLMAGVGTGLKCGNKLLSVGVTYTYGEGQLTGYRSDAQLQIEFQF